MKIALVHCIQTAEDIVNRQTSFFCPVNLVFNANADTQLQWEPFIGGVKYKVRWANL